MLTDNYEETVDSDWKILVAAAKQASKVEGLRQRRNSCPVISYEEFLKELKKDTAQKSKHSDDSDDEDNNNNGTKLAAEANEHGDIYSLGDWKSDDEREEMCDDERTIENCKNQLMKRKKDKFYKQYVPSKLTAEHPKDDYSSSSSLDKDHCRDLHVYSQDESSWESMSSGSTDDDKSFEEFVNISKHKTLPEDDQNCLPYRNLTRCMFTHYYPDSENNCKITHQCKFVKKRKPGYDYQTEYSRNGQLPLEERIPLMQVLDALDDINKVLKVGKITPRMERILEYKQDYPFTEGYHEESLGWCPWLVYKMERLCKKLSAKQWPY